MLHVNYSQSVIIAISPAGFPIDGTIPESGARPVFSAEEAEKRRRKEGPRSRGFICQQDESVQRSIAKEFRSHVERGWVSPVHRDEIDSSQHIQPVFGAVQKNKVRSIVDASWFNMHTLETDRLSLPTNKVIACDIFYESSDHKIDIADTFRSSREISALARDHIKSVKKEDLKKFDFEAAAKFFHEALPTLNFGGHKDVIWRGVSLLALDFSNAYRQLATLNPSLNLLEVWDPDRKVFDLYTSNVLTFGSIASVYAWTRVSLLVEHCVEYYFGITVYIYIDDLLAVLPDNTAEDMVDAIVSFVKLLGFELKAEKRQFGKSVRALGVDYEILPDGFTTTIDEQSKCNLIHSVAEVKSDAEAGLPIAAKRFRSIAGRSNFLIVLTFLTHLRFAVAPFFAFTKGPKNKVIQPSHPDYGGLPQICKLFIQLLSTNLAYTFLHKVYEASPITIFVDASLEKLAAIVVDNSVVTYLYEDIPKNFPELIPGGNTIVVYEALIILIVRVLLSERLHNRVSAVFSDSTGAFLSLVKGASRNPQLSLISHLTTKLSISSPMVARYISTHLNPADGITRMCELMVQFLDQVLAGCERVRFAPEIFEYVLIDALK